MVWKQDLAKLKAQLREEPAPPPPRKVVAAPPATPPQSMEEEDALFLAMMGRRAPRPAPPAARLPEAPEAAAPSAEAPAPPQDFASALAGLKGMRPLQMDPVLSAGTGGGPAPQREAAPMAPPPAPSPEAAPEPPPVQASVEAPAVAVPVRIQLAAGMAVDVDGALDLRGHSLQDALERLKDRVADIQYLHWRSLLVQLGPEPGHQEGLQTLLAQGGLPGVARFAQAPIPMGGPQAWILYLNA